MSEEAKPGAELIKRRFIAGAVCPQCRAQDRLRVDYWRTPEGELQEQHCVACGYRQQDEAGADALPTLPRIRRGRQSPTVESEPVRLLDPATLPKSTKD